MPSPPDSRFAHDTAGVELTDTMRLAGIYLNDNDVLVLAERLRRLGLNGFADSLTNAYYRDVHELDVAASELQAIVPALELEESPASFEALREELQGQATSIAEPRESRPQRRYHASHLAGSSGTSNVAASILRST